MRCSAGACFRCLITVNRATVVSLRSSENQSSREQMPAKARCQFLFDNWNACKLIKFMFTIHCTDKLVKGIDPVQKDLFIPRPKREMQARRSRLTDKYQAILRASPGSVRGPNRATLPRKTGLPSPRNAGQLPNRSPNLYGSCIPTRWTEGTRGPLAPYLEAFQLPNYFSIQLNRIAYIHARAF